jgi:hypothetical protein
VRGPALLARVCAHNPQAASDAITAGFAGHTLHRIARHSHRWPAPTLDLVTMAALGRAPRAEGQLVTHDCPWAALPVVTARGSVPEGLVRSWDLALR